LIYRAIPLVRGADGTPIGCRFQESHVLQSGSVRRDAARFALAIAKGCNYDSLEQT
jgi:hypothetical protein